MKWSQSVISIVCLCSSFFSQTLLPAQTVKHKQSASAGKPISPDLFGVFFEDLSYAADGGLYAELIQNRSFEYSASDKKGWHPFTAWEFITEGHGYGTMEIETNSPVHINNHHYAVLNVDEEGTGGAGLINAGFDGIVIRAGEQYDFSFFVKQLSNHSIPLQVRLQGKKGIVYGEAAFTTDGKDWKKYTATITASKNDDSASLVIMAKAKGKLAIDVVSLFPQKTFKNRPNGLRPDIAQTIADLKPKFMRFPGGCLVHGNGLNNMYRWENTIGPIEQRVEQRNTWNYHQTVGLGYFEYFQFCEDIGAKPLPVVAAAVSCQGSGGTWGIGAIGQRALPMQDMKDYVQEVLDLVEYANGPVTSTWGAKRAEAGHPEPFNLEYIGIGNEDKISPEFKERFKMIYDAVRAKYPDIKLIGTAGPGPSGTDFEQAWNLADELNIEMLDEHYYEKPEWFLNNLKRYDKYSRAASSVYLGEYAAHDVDRKNTLRSALAEAAYLASLERNGDIVKMISYAPLLANKNHVNWNPNLVYFTNTNILLTVNYYVQQLFSVNQGDLYFSNIISTSLPDTAKTFAASCVKNTSTGNVIVKLVNTDSSSVKANINLSAFRSLDPAAICTVLSGELQAENTFEHPKNIAPVTSAFTISKSFAYNVPAYSMTVITIKAKK